MSFFSRFAVDAPSVLLGAARGRGDGGDSGGHRQTGHANPLDDMELVREICQRQKADKSVGLYFHCFKPASPAFGSFESAAQSEFFKRGSRSVRVCSKFSKGGGRPGRELRPVAPDCPASSTSAKALFSERQLVGHPPAKSIAFDTLLKDAYQNYKNNFYSKSHQQRSQEPLCGDTPVLATATSTALETPDSIAKREGGKNNHNVIVGPFRLSATSQTSLNLGSPERIPAGSKCHPDLSVRHCPAPVKPSALHSLPVTWHALSARELPRHRLLLG